MADARRTIEKPLQKQFDRTATRVVCHDVTPKNEGAPLSLSPDKLQRLISILNSERDTASRKSQSTA